MSLLVGAAVRHEIQGLATDPEVVQERTPLRRSAIGSEPVTARLEVAQERRESAAESADVVAEVCIPCRERAPRRVLGFEDRLDVRSHRADAGVLEPHPQRAAVNRFYARIEHLEASAGGEAAHRRQREIEDVLVVYGVELDALEHVPDPGELEHDSPRRSQAAPHRLQEVVDLRHVREDVVPDHQVGRAECLEHLGHSFETEEPAEGRDPPRPRVGRDVGGRLHAEHGDAARLEVLQEVSVVASDL